MEPLKTLLVEDDPTTRRLLEAILGARGYDVTACGDAEAAWSFYERSAYPLVVLDWLLPGMDGLQLCRRMRGLPHGDRSFIVVLTGRDQPDDLQAVLDAGADDFLTKPVDIPRLSVRLAIAERQIGNLLERKAAETRVGEMMVQLEESRDDLLSILNQLRAGSAMTDSGGRITFLSQSCQKLFGGDSTQLIGQPWEQSCPFDEPARAALRQATSLPPGQRPRVAAYIDAPQGRRYWVEVDVKDDPRDPQRKIFFLYDVSEVHDLRRLLTEHGQFEDLIGKSAPMLRVFEQIRAVAAVDSTVLIEGETGTGKELVARAIHNASQRRDRPFIAVNCAGLTESLLDSQLFGHKRGAFTGSIEDHKGLFEAANGGTIFLDEIGDVPMSVQTSLLRVLQEREIVRLGESKPRKIDVRVIAATHHNLADEMAKGRFRSDLLYRIRVARIQLPPLRDRREDIPLLTKAFLDQLRAETAHRVTEISRDAMGLLLSHGWPGNVRELKGAMEFAVICCTGSVIEASELPPEIIEAPTSSLKPRGDSVDEPARIARALEQARGNRVLAARLLGISRATLYRRLAELNITPK